MCTASLEQCNIEWRLHCTDSIFCSTSTAHKFSTGREHWRCHCVISHRYITLYCKLLKCSLSSQCRYIQWRLHSTAVQYCTDSIFCSSSSEHKHTLGLNCSKLLISQLNKFASVSCITSCASVFSEQLMCWNHRLMILPTFHVLSKCAQLWTSASLWRPQIFQLSILLLVTGWI